MRKITWKSKPIASSLQQISLKQLRSMLVFLIMQSGGIKIFEFRNRYHFMSFFKMSSVVVTFKDFYSRLLKTSLCKMPIGQSLHERSKFNLELLRAATEFHSSMISNWSRRTCSKYFAEEKTHEVYWTNAASTSDNVTHRLYARITYLTSIRSDWGINIVQLISYCIFIVIACNKFYFSCLLSYWISTQHYDKNKIYLK